MKVLFIEWESFGNGDIKDAFTEEGHSVICFPFTLEGKLRHDPEVEAQLSFALHREGPDIVFSFNYFPVISKVCQKEGIRYISWVYDSPCVLLYSYTTLNSCNCIYVFDRELYQEFHDGGIQTVHYMPLAANTRRLDEKNAALGDSFLYDVSFVGSLYVERWNYFDKMAAGLPDYARGYLDALMIAQSKVQGVNFIQDLLNPVMGELYQAFPMETNEDGIEPKEYFYAQYVINRKLTAWERIDLLATAARNHRVDLFTYDQSFQAPNLQNHGKADYREEMPQIFRQSKINLNISLRSIKSGIPLRAFDIMGSGGFLLSNYQADFLELFVPGEDFEVYGSKEEYLQKIDYYLRHEEERKAIARNGHDKVAAGHTFRHRVREMMDLLGDR